MNKRTLRILLDMFIAIAISVTTHRLMLIAMASFEGLTISLILVPLIWLALRHGAAPAILASTIVGIINGLIDFHFTEWVNIILYEILPLYASGLAAVFSKYTQKTLNNRRYASTYLNISTASILVTLVYFTVKHFLVPLGLGEPMDYRLNQANLWISLGIMIAAAIVILCGIAKALPKWIIPPRSKYLSRKETSRLLND